MHYLKLLLFALFKRFLNQIIRRLTEHEVALQIMAILRQNDDDRVQRVCRKTDAEQQNWLERCARNKTENKMTC